MTNLFVITNTTQFTAPSPYSWIVRRQRCSVPVPVPLHHPSTGTSSLKSCSKCHVDLGDFAQLHQKLAQPKLCTKGSVHNCVHLIKVWSQIDIARSLCPHLILKALLMKVNQKKSKIEEVKKFRKKVWFYHHSGSGGLLKAAEGTLLLGIQTTMKKSYLDCQFKISIHGTLLALWSMSYPSILENEKFRWETSMTTHSHRCWGSVLRFPGTTSNR